MDVTNSPNKPGLLSRLQARYPDFTFAKGDTFRWASSEKTIYFMPGLLQSAEGEHDLLHELAHGVLQHHSYSYDIDLLRLEAEAWHWVETEGYSFLTTALDHDHIQSSLDSYRYWLTERSTCPSCQATGIQKNTRTYQCINCRCVWRVNSAKFCGLRRYLL